jgi:NAD(P)-dependent dehydrogenase (short-subunit alcohol dehydrogenase family)
MVKNKIIVITGGAGLLGQEFVRAALENGGIVVIADIDKASAEKVIAEISTATDQVKAQFHALDITSEKSVDILIKTISEKFGKIDVWVNNAYPKTKIMGTVTKREYSNSFFDMNYEDFCKSVSLNLGSMFLCSQRIAAYYIKQGYGNIINISSIYGLIAPRFEVYDSTGMTMPVDYAVNKSAMNHFTRYLAKLLKGKNIRVNSLSPGGVFNNQPEDFVNEYGKLALNKGMLGKEDVSGTLLFLVSDHSKYINGQNLVVDDGWTL